MNRDRHIDAATLPELDLTSAVPRYRQIADGIATSMLDAVPGARIPSEHEIVARFGVSRATAGRALADLEQRGLVTRQQGRGTFAAEAGRAIRTNTHVGLPSFSEDLRRSGRVTHQTIRRAAISRPPAEVASALALTGDQTAWVVERTIEGDGVPIAFVTSWLPTNIYPELGASEIGRTSLYEHLVERYGIDARPCSSDELWSAAAATATTARRLGIAVGAPVMRVLRRAFLADHATPSEYSVSYLRGDAFAVALQVRGTAPPSLRFGEAAELDTLQEVLP